MIPLLVFLLACVAVYLGTILAAFSALMRFSLRMMAESAAGPRDLLGAFLEDPPALFFPARVLLGVVTVIVAVLLAHVEGVGRTDHGLWLFLASMLVFVFVCFLLLPQLIVRSQPQVIRRRCCRRLRWLRRAFAPFTHLMAGVNGSDRRPTRHHRPKKSSPRRKPRRRPTPRRTRRRPVSCSGRLSASRNASSAK